MSQGFVKLPTSPYEFTSLISMKGSSENMGNFTQLSEQNRSLCVTWSYHVKAVHVLRHVNTQEGGETERKEVDSVTNHFTKSFEMYNYIYAKCV